MKITVDTNRVVDLLILSQKTMNLVDILSEKQKTNFNNLGDRFFDLALDMMGVPVDNTVEKGGTGEEYCRDSFIVDFLDLPKENRVAVEKFVEETLSHVQELRQG